MNANSVLPSTDCVVHDPLEHECVVEVVPPRNSLDWAKPCTVPVLGNQGDDGLHVFSPDMEVEPVSNVFCYSQPVQVISEPSPEAERRNAMSVATR
jgi:hypothetical protein